MLRGAERLNRRAIFWHQPAYTFGFDQSPCSVVRAGDYKLIEFFENQSVELYDLHKDIGEATNLAEEMPEKVEELKRQLHDWRAAVKTPLPKRNARNWPWPSHLPPGWERW